MKTIIKALIVCASCASIAAAQFTAAGDSVYTTPAKPTTKDSITYNFYDSDACCCAEFVNPSVSVSDTMVDLVFSVNTAPCQACRCLLPGAWHAFKGGMLKAGRYGIYRVQSFYCPPGTVCPAIVLLPVRIGEVVVRTPTSATPFAETPKALSTLTLNQVKNMVNLSYYLSQPGHVSVNVYDPRGILAAVLYNGQAVSGAHSASWTATAPGIYVVSVETNGIVAASRKVVVSR
jgi:hypothetical protein